MKKPYQLLLHIGLPKTATTSFQSNVCLPLHQEGKINFLGKAHRHTRNMHHPLKDMLWRVCNEQLTKEQIAIFRGEVEKILYPDKLNILSYEDISSLGRAPLATDIMFNQISQIFASCDIHCLISLRSPVDFVFSRYVESYYWYLYKDKSRNTFEKFANHLLNHPTLVQHAAGFYEDYLSLVDQYFAHKTVLLFEDLSHDPAHYFKTLSALLGVDANDVKTRFLTTKLNVGRLTPSGKLSRPITVSHIVRTSKLHNKRPSLKYITPLKVVWRLLLKLMDKIEVKKTVHRYPNDKLHTKLLVLLAIKDIDIFAKQHSVDKQKLAQYGYIQP